MVRATSPGAANEGLSSLRLVVFDLAGTTIQDGGAVLRCLVETVAEFDLPGDATELNALMGLSKREVFALLAGRRYGVDSSRIDSVSTDALESFVTRMAAAYERDLRPIAGAEETFDFLRDRGIRVATDTGFDRAIASLVMDRLGWVGRSIDLAVNSSDVPRGRPAPYMIFRAMELLDITSVREVMKVGDAPADLEEGWNAGCAEIIGVLNGSHTAELLEPYPHTRLLGSVAEIPRLFESEAG